MRDFTSKFTKCIIKKTNGKQENMRRESLSVRIQGNDENFKANVYMENISTRAYTLSL